MFGNKKTPKHQEPDKCLYTIYHPFKASSEARAWAGDSYKFFSIDPSIKNFGLRTEIRSHDGKNISTVSTSRTSLEPPCVRKPKNAPPVKEKAPTSVVCDIYEKTDVLLNSEIENIRTSHFIIMERQIPRNYKAVRLSQHVLDFICEKVRDSPLMPIIIELDSKVKARYLGCPRGLNERQTKLWLIEKAIQLLDWRGDKETANLIRTVKKKDDLADTVCQIEGFCKLNGQLPMTLVPAGVDTNVHLPVILQQPEESKKKKKASAKGQAQGLVGFLLAKPSAPSLPSTDPVPAPMPKLVLKKKK